MIAHAATATDVTGDPWMFHMRRGDFNAAWEISDEVLRARRGVPCWHMPRHQQYIWDGTPLDGKRVLVRCYHGLGDTVQFIRFIPLVKAIAREVIVWAQPALLPILSTVRGIDRLMPLHDGVPDVDYDVDVESMELAHIFRVSPISLAQWVPYLNVTPDANVRPSRRPPSTRHVGLVWSCGSQDETRSIPLRLFEPLLEMRNICWHVLQRGSPLAEWARNIGMRDGSDDVEQTARTMCSLDLLISVDSFPVHLAGAIGLPVWTLLHAHADWRWMIGREDSPWYPTMRLFRQTSAGGWVALIERVKESLGRDVSHRG
jgi:hypothetical protein